jgi:hypothetical protein
MGARSFDGAGCFGASAEVVRRLELAVCWEQWHTFAVTVPGRIALQARVLQGLVGAALVAWGCGGRSNTEGAFGRGEPAGANSSAGWAGAVHGSSSAGSGGSVGAAGTSLSGQMPPPGQVILFEVTYHNTGWDNVFSGIYLTRDGEVYAFDYYETNSRSAIPSGLGSATAADLRARYGDSPRLLGSIAQALLFEKYATVQATKTGLLVRARTGNDMGQTLFWACEYDAQTETYSQVTLGGWGDHRVWNLSPAAQPVVDWLCEFLSREPVVGDPDIVPEAVPDCGSCDGVETMCVSSGDGVKYCSSRDGCTRGCECRWVCGGGTAYCRDGGADGLYCSGE